MEQYTEAFVGIDTAKNKHALAIADPGRDGEIQYLGEIDSVPAAVRWRTGTHPKPTPGAGIKRQILWLF